MAWVFVFAVVATLAAWAYCAGNGKVQLGTQVSGTIKALDATSTAACDAAR